MNASEIRMPVGWQGGGEETYLMLGGEGWPPRVGDISPKAISIRKSQSRKEGGKSASKSGTATTKTLKARQILGCLRT